RKPDRAACQWRDHGLAAWPPQRSATAGQAYEDGCGSGAGRLDRRSFRAAALWQGARTVAIGNAENPYSLKALFTSKVLTQLLVLRMSVYGDGRDCAVVAFAVTARGRVGADD